MRSPEKLVQTIRSAWTRETTCLPDEWDPQTNPARGQCVAAALVVQDYLGGDIVCVEAQVANRCETHYQNILPSGSIMDVTSDQYPAAQTFTIVPVIGRAPYETLRDYMLSHPGTRYRYQLLTAGVDTLLSLELEVS